MLSDEVPLTTLHTNGWHVTKVRYCTCPTAPTYAVQLFRARLFPASYERPATAFSFDVLDIFEELTLKSKIGMFDFFESMLAVTGKNLPSTHVSLASGAFAQRTDMDSTVCVV
jgi:hypothetical protein